MLVFLRDPLTLLPRLTPTLLDSLATDLWSARSTHVVPMPGYIYGYCNLPYDEGVSVIRLEFITFEGKYMAFMFVFK